MQSVSPVMSNTKEKLSKREKETVRYSISGDGVLSVSSSDLLRSKYVQEQIEALKEQRAKIQEHTTNPSE